VDWNALEADLKSFGGDYQVDFKVQTMRFGWGWVGWIRMGDVKNAMTKLGQDFPDITRRWGWEVSLHPRKLYGIGDLLTAYHLLGGFYPQWYYILDIS
jgi:hypothetical protein